MSNQAREAPTDPLREALQAYVDYDEYINGPNGDPSTDRLQRARAALAAEPAKRDEAEPDLMRGRDGAIAMAAMQCMEFGFYGVHKPPEGHWLTAVWERGRCLAEADPRDEPPIRHEAPAEHHNWNSRAALASEPAVIQQAGTEPSEVVSMPGWIRCPDCDGSAEHVYNDHNGDPQQDYAVPCPTCNKEQAGSAAPEPTLPHRITRNDATHVKPECRPSYAEGWNDCRTAMLGSAAPAPATETLTGREVRIDYTNWRGERALRVIRPAEIRFASHRPYHPDEQWLLRAYDVEKGDMRDFAMRDIHSWQFAKENTNDR